MCAVCSKVFRAFRSIFQSVLSTLISLFVFYYAIFLPKLCASLHVSARVSSCTFLSFQQLNIQLIRVTGPVFAAGCSIPRSTSPPPSEERLVTCPFKPAHNVKEGRLDNHISKCRKGSSHTLSTYWFNGNHLVPAEALHKRVTWHVPTIRALATQGTNRQQRQMHCTRSGQ